MNPLAYTLLGPIYSERKVAKFFKKQGYHVLRNTYVYGTPKGFCNGYAEIDVIGLAHDHMVTVEVKSWKGKFFANDDKIAKGLGAFWSKKGRNIKLKSPYQQAKRARRIFKETLVRDFIGKEQDENFVKTLVVLDRGQVDASPEVQQKWHSDRVTVIHMKDFLKGSLAETSLPPQHIIEEFNAYKTFFKLPWYAPFLHNFPKLRKKYLHKKQVLWKKWMNHPLRKR